LSYQALRLDGNGYCQITDANQSGLDMGLSDFMLEARVKSSPIGAMQCIAHKYVGIGWMWHIDDDGRIRFRIRSALGDVYSWSISSWDDGRWHHLVIVVDRSGNCYHYVDGSLDGSDPIVTVADSVSNATALEVGVYGGGNFLVSDLDELRVFNFGYGGLPSDYADYITWLSQGRNWLKDISEYNSGSWNCYADADREEKVTDGGLENWTTDTNLTSWTEYGVSAGVRDIDKSTTKHGGSYAVKLEATLNDGTLFMIYQTLASDLEANKYYELQRWVYFPTRTAGSAYSDITNTTDGSMAAVNVIATNAAYTEYPRIFKPTVEAGNTVWLKLSTETTTGIIYFDDISLKRTGLVGHWKFNGDYTDETTNSNTLTAGGTGNAFVGYTLKRDKIISPYSIR